MFGAKAAAENFTRQVSQKTGLIAQGDRFMGTFYGLPAWCKAEMVADRAGALMGNGGMFGALSALTSGGKGGMAVAMTGGDFFMKHDYVVDIPGNNYPPSSLRESSSFLINKGFQQRPALGQKVSSGVAWIDRKYEVASSHPEFMPYVCAWHELQQALQNWHYVNLSWNGSQVWLELLDTVFRITTKFSTKSQQNGDMILKGLHVVAAAARATYAR